MPTASSIQTAALRSATTLVKLMPSSTEFRSTPACVRWCYWSASREKGTNPAVGKMQRSTFKVEAWNHYRGTSQCFHYPEKVWAVEQRRDSNFEHNWSLSATVRRMHSWVT